MTQHHDNHEKTNSTRTNLPTKQGDFDEIIPEIDDKTEIEPDAEFEPIILRDPQTGQSLKPAESPPLEHRQEESMASPADDGFTDPHIQSPHGSTGESDTTATAQTTGIDDTLVSQFITELRERELTDDELAALRTSLGLAAPQSLTNRIAHVQNKIDEFSASATIPEESSATDQTLNSRVDDLQSNLETMQSELHHLESSLASTHAALSSIEDQLADLTTQSLTETDFKMHAHTIEDRFVTEEKFNNQFNTVQTELLSLQEEVKQGKVWRNAITNAINPSEKAVSTDEPLHQSNSDPDRSE